MSLPGLPLPSLPSFPSFDLPGPLGSLLGGGPANPPLYTQLPKVQTAFTRKYSDPGLQSALSSLPPSISNSFTAYDLQRVNRGQMPLTGSQTLGALKTAVDQKAATPPPDEGFLGNALADLRSLIDIPHMVTGLVSEAQQLPEAPQKLSEVLGRGDLRDIVAGLQEVPGLRLVPGVYTASTLAQGGPGALLQHPLYTALDVLPYVKEPIASLANTLAGKVPRVAAEAARVATPEVQADIAAQNAARVEAGVRPLPTEPSNVRLLGRTSPMLQEFVTSRPLYQALATRFGEYARDLAQLRSGAENRLALWANAETPADHPALATVDPSLRDIVTQSQTWGDIPLERQIELGNRLRTEHTPDVLASLTDDRELALANWLDEKANVLADYGVHQDMLKRLDGQIFTPDQYQTIMNARNKVTAATAIRDLRTRIAQASPADEFPHLDPADVLNEDMTNKWARTVGQGYAQLLDKSGFDGDLVRKAANAKGATRDDVAAAMRAAQADQVEKTLMSRQEILDAIDAQAKTDPSYAAARAHIRAGNWQDAVNQWRNTIGSRRQHIHPQSDAIYDSMQRYADMDRFNARTEAYTDRRVASLEAKQAKVEDRVLPASLMPVVENLRYVPGDRTTALYHLYGDNPEALRHLDQGFPEMVQGLRDNPQELRATERALVSQVQEMRRNGLKTVWSHQVAPDKVSQIIHPHITDWMKDPSLIRERTFDTVPYHENPTVAMSHGAVEYMTKKVQDQFVDDFVNIFGKDQTTAYAEIRDLAQTLARGNPIKARQIANTLIRRNYEPYNPDQMFPGSGAGLRMRPDERIYIPKVIDNARKEMFEKQPYRFAQALDKPMNLFRTSVLAYRPAFHANNIAGGLILMALQEPGTIPYMLSHYPEISKWIRSGEREMVPGAPPGGMGFYPREINEWLDRTTTADRVAAIHDLQGATTARRWVGEMLGAGSNVVDALRRGAQWSYDKNQLVDNFYRSTAYKYAFDKELNAQIRGGFAADSPEAVARAQQAGVALERKVLPQWDRMTPFERTVIRSFFPFYSFSKFLIDYALHFPMDHPYRAAVMASLARKEREDFGDWLPSNFSRMFFVGKPDKNGVVKAITPGALNPFQDLSSMFTIGGLLGRTNPLIVATMKSIGIDPSKGSQDLYPDVSYDPTTGTLKPRNPGLLGNILGSFIPQSQVVSALIGHNENFKGLLQANPEAAATMLRSGLGLPNFYRDINVPQEAFRAEVQRENVQQQVRNKALRTGDWSEAMKYPGLRPQFAHIQQLLASNPAALRAYRSQVAANTTPDALKLALIERTVPVG